MNKGLFITFEGIDTAGKSTQAKLLETKLRLEGHSVYSCHFPEYNSPTGKLIKEVLDGKITMNKKALQLLYVADQINQHETIKRHLALGSVVICDRYDLSTAVYYACTSQDPSGFNYIYDNAQRGFLRPDLTFVLTMKQSEIEKRKEHLDVLEKNSELMIDIASHYRTIRNHINDHRKLVRIDATQTIAEIENRISKETKYVMKGVL